MTLLTSGLSVCGFGEPMNWILAQPGAHRSSHVFIEFLEVIG